MKKPNTHTHTRHPFCTTSPSPVSIEQPPKKYHEKIQPFLLMFSRHPRLKKQKNNSPRPQSSMMFNMKPQKWWIPNPKSLYPAGPHFWNSRLIFGHFLYNLGRFSSSQGNLNNLPQRGFCNQSASLVMDGKWRRQPQGAFSHLPKDAHDWFAQQKSHVWGIMKEQLMGFITC